MNPSVSVLIPIYNAQHTVESALHSIIRQIYTDFELIAVNDGSTDSTPHILEVIAQSDQRVRVIHTPNRGIIHALNTGIDAARGSLIARMDADDISHPRRLELQAEYLNANPNISVCSSRVKMFPRQRLMGGLVRYERWLNCLIEHSEIVRDIYIESPIAHPSVMMRKSELVELGGYQENGWAEDYDLWLRYHQAGHQFSKQTQTLVCWRQSEGRLTFTDSRYSVENFIRAKAHYLAQGLKHIDRPIVVWGAGKTGRRLGKQLVRAGLDFEGFLDVSQEKIGHKMRGKPIYSYTSLESRPGVFVISAVSSEASRRLIREYLSGLGRVELRDFICAA